MSLLFLVKNSDVPKCQMFLWPNGRMIGSVSCWVFTKGLERTSNAMQKTWVQSLGKEDHLVKKMATHSSILA